MPVGPTPSPSTPPAQTRKFDDAPGVIGISRDELPALPDAIMTDPEAGRLDPRAWFAHPEHPFEIEIGTGKGSFLIQQAASDPGTNYLGIEWEGEIYAYAADRLRRRGLTNVRMLRADASAFLRWRCPASIVRVIHLYYSDPWPKAKHHKNRVIQHGFLADVWRVLVPTGELRIVTDHDELWAWNLTHIQAWTGTPGPLPPDVRTGAIGASMPAIPFELSSFVPPQWADEGQVVGTNYERKFTNAEHRPHSCVLRRA